MFLDIFGKKKDLALREVKFFNTESSTLEVFSPLKSPYVTMYSCGPTVYDYAHIGNLRSYVFADILKRVLVRNGYLVKHTINFTDFGHLSDDGDEGEDKMMKGLKREGLPVSLEGMKELGDKYIKAFVDDTEELRIIPPSTWARASEYVGKQISLVKTLDDKGFTYETSDGVYFDIKQFPAYGRLGNINLEKLKSGARVEVNTEKHHPADFAVWKKSELGWKSRFGTGFPGWHIECSAMALATLGKQIDIHTGGIDHIATHHNAEIAQSEGATGRRFVKYWMHNAFITIDNTKVSKSLGNTITMRHLRDRGFTGDDYRYWLLTAHYRSPINFSWDALKASKQALFRLKRYMYEDFKQKSAIPDATYMERFEKHLADDLDTPGAIAVLWEMIKDEKIDAKTKCGTLMAMDEVLDIGLSEDVTDGVRSLGVVGQEELPVDIQALIDKREAARIARNWAEADFLREAILRKGFTVEDTPQGPKLTKVE
ncbi:MAG: cysteine--tRNA ligase [Candidatus Pacebacteria bacterium]|nr:cysteine--tRNA ligase [Candidatus Paceibacterota bacterium]MBP9842798.1 cysteine--tRNA ligase [Candidatus Paceibacterota bacterium]